MSYQIELLVSDASTWFRVGDTKPSLRPHEYVREYLHFNTVYGIKQLPTAVCCASELDSDAGVYSYITSRSKDNSASVISLVMHTREDGVLVAQGYNPVTRLPLWLGGSVLHLGNEGYKNDRVIPKAVIDTSLRVLLGNLELGIKPLDT